MIRHDRRKRPPTVLSLSSSWNVQERDKSEPRSAVTRFAWTFPLAKENDWTINTRWENRDSVSINADDIWMGWRGNSHSIKNRLILIKLIDSFDSIRLAKTLPNNSIDYLFVDVTHQGFVQAWSLSFHFESIRSPYPRLDRSYTRLIQWWTHIDEYSYWSLIFVVTLTREKQQH